MKITLVHNEAAGNGQEPDDLVRLLENAGHKARHRSSKRDWQLLLQEPTDMIVVAGGDGTVGK